GRNGWRRLFLNFGAVRNRSGRVHLRCGRAWCAIGVGYRDDSGVGGGTEAARDRPGTVPEQVKSRSLRDSEAYGFADVDHGILSGGRLEEWRVALRKCGASKTAACETDQFAGGSAGQRVRQKSTGAG